MSRVKATSEPSHSNISIATRIAELVSRSGVTVRYVRSYQTPDSNVVAIRKNYEEWLTERIVKIIEKK